MKTIQSILVGLDVQDHGTALTPGSRAAAAQALYLGRELGARVDFLHSVFDDPEQRGSFTVGGELGAQEEATGLHQAAGVEGSAWTVVDERPDAALVRGKVEGNHDLIVMAKRAEHSRTERLLGTVSSKVVHAAPGTVWVVHPDHAAPPTSVLSATDLTPVGDRAVALGADVARLTGAHLSVAHAWQLPMELQLSAARMGHEAAQARRLEIAGEAEAHIRGLEALSGLDVELFIACDGPARWIRHVAEERRPDLVVLGTVSRGGLAGVLVGNTAEKLLHRLDASLLTIKPDDFVCPLAL